ncbi:flagellar brake protein [Cellvibrio sp. PSBB023]|uniref:flagellar brake protein n=1 Tax=Cellvibrio sp. PSBB023 TaxID=1945512 RepID=UPI00098FA051|nr:flagellar brake protein [Cellvibrio sp. PSBB023]AQT60530.1 flagellar brake protein [Cellvibrio sp. PSBB023]
MKFEDLKLAYGYPLQLQTTSLSGQPERFSCRLIGCLPGRSLLLSVPKLAGKLVRFRAGQKIVVRLMIDNGIGIFAGVVETQTMDPYPILHLSFPESVTFKGIRSATRVAVQERVEILSAHGDNVQSTPGFISDISINGCRIELGTDIAELGDSLTLKTEVDIRGVKRLLLLKGIVRSRVDATDNVDEGALVSYGIEFSDQSDDERLVMYAYVFSHMAQQDQTAD